MIIVVTGGGISVVFAPDQCCQSKERAVPVGEINCKSTLAIELLVFTPFVRRLYHLQLIVAASLSQGTFTTTLYLAQESEKPL